MNIYDLKKLMFFPNIEYTFIGSQKYKIDPKLLKKFTLVWNSKGSFQEFFQIFPKQSTIFKK